jgi:hypothetical protein
MTGGPVAQARAKTSAAAVSAPISRVVRHSESSKKVIGGFAPKPPKSQRVRASRNNKRPADPEAQGVIPVIGRGPVAEGRADVLRPAAPGTAADDAGGAISTSPR